MGNLARASKTTAATSTTQQRAERLDRAVEDIKQEWSTATRAITNVGHIVLDTCFGGDARALLDAGAQRNPVFAELSRRVDTLGLGLSKSMMSVNV